MPGLREQGAAGVLLALVPPLCAVGGLDSRRGKEYNIRVWKMNAITTAEAWAQEQAQGIMEPYQWHREAFLRLMRTLPPQPPPLGVSLRAMGEWDRAQFLADCRKLKK